jgi:hypothetical protein
MPFGSLEGETANLSGELANLFGKAHTIPFSDMVHATRTMLGSGVVYLQRAANAHRLKTRL